jgi:hypothetical protein
MKSRILSYIFLILLIPSLLFAGGAVLIKDTFLARTPDAIYMIKTAIANNDRNTMQMLFQRGYFMVLEEGTKVDVASCRDEICLINIHIDCSEHPDGHDIQGFILKVDLSIFPEA